MTINPLVAAKLDAPVDAWAGVWIAEDIELINQGVHNGSWIDTGLGTVGAGLDALAFVSDPVGALLQYGVAWLIEHVEPLREALDWLAGNPAQIAAHAQTWRNVAASLNDQAADLAAAVTADVAYWQGTAADAYRAWATQQQQAINGLSKGAETIATITEAAGFLIAAVRIMVRDAIAILVSRLIVYAIEEAASLGFATPLVVEQATTLIAAWAAKIAQWLKQLIASLRRLSGLASELDDLINQLKKILDRLRRHGDEPETPHESPNGRPDPTVAHQQRIDDLARDPANGGKITGSSLAEAEVGVGLEERGAVEGLRRSPNPAEEFIDSQGRPWDVKAFHSEHGRFNLETAMRKIIQEMTWSKENIMLDTRNLSPTDLAQLRDAVKEATARGELPLEVLWWP
jgi:uncharacterized protein YukE